MIHILLRKTCKCSKNETQGMFPSSRGKNPSLAACSEELVRDVHSTPIQTGSDNPPGSTTLNRGVLLKA
jgi:hypothetical protein